MDFLTDPIFTDLGRSDFIGGIDNEALDFGHLEQFMQVAASVGSAGETNDSNGNVIDASAAKTETPTTLPNSATISITNRPIATVSARVSLTTPTTPIATPLAANINSTHAHLPESPPDSGSEPPYSPLQDIHGLTLTSRDSLAATNGGVIFNALSATAGLQSHQHPLGQPAIHLSPQFTPPHSQHQQHHHSTNSHFPHHSHNHQPQHYLNNAHHMELERGGEIRIKHEAGLIMHASNLAAQQQSPSETHLELATQQQPQLLYAAGNTVTAFESEGVGLYAASDYQHLANTAGTLGQAAICLMNPETATPRVHVIGTATPQSQSNRSSAPSTPIHRSSTRKRKMSTQLDCADFPGMKADPGLSMSPAGKMNCNTPQYPFTPESQKLGPTSPVSISLPTPSGDCNNSALSSASLSPALSTVNSNQENSMDGSVAPSTNGENADANALTPCIRFSPFQPQNWHKLCDQSLQELSVVYYRVDADKGFNFSVSDDAFVCQKKNHFQVTCHARLQGDAKFVKTPSGLEKIKAFHLHFYGVKLESPNQTIRVEQSQSDRSKKPFYPVPIDLQSHIVSKITVGRLHFSETTNNNMRKKGRPNPEQRYFQLVVGLHVHTMSGNFPVISQGSERIIVRASNPGQFESDVDLCWQRGITQDSIFHAGRVGINTDRPDESLVVHGNLKVSGHIVQPSDSRAKQEIGELDTSVQLRNLQKIRIVRYRYEPEFAIHSGLRRASASDSEEIVDTGVIAQEVREVIPDAVQEAGSITLPNGSVIENFLLVNKDRILMENIGAVKELCKVTGHLESRIESLELMNSRLMRKKEYDLEREASRLKNTETCSNRNLQIIIFMLVIIMAACLTAVSTLYFLEHNKQHHSNSKRLERLQLQQHPSGSHAHDAQVLSEQERHYLQLRNFLHSNASKAHATWPDYFFGLATTRPPSFVRSKSPTGMANSKNITTSGQEIAYNESGEFYSANGRTDELAVVMEKPVLSLQPLQSLQEPHRVTTSAPPPLRSNKTVTSKTKLKWPLPHVVLQAAANMQQVPPTNGFRHDILAVAGNIVEITSLATVRNSGFQPATNDSESSTEKVGAVAIPQDFENNSIDIDARQTTIRKKSTINKISAAVSTATASPNSAAHDAALKIASVDTDITLNIDSHHNSDKVASTSSSNSLSIAETTATAHNLNLGADIGGVETSILNVYKTITPTTPALVISTHRIGENLSGSSSLEVPPLSNKNESVLESLSETADALDLQNLSNNNESADNPVAALFGIDLTGRDSVLGARSTIDHRASHTWMQRKTIEVETFGAPEQCLQQSSRDDISNCQSVCFEGSNQLSAPRQHIRSPSIDSKNSIPILENQAQNVDSSVEDDDVEVDADPIDEIEETQKLPIASFIVKKQNSTIIATGKISHATQAIAKQFSPERHTKDTDTLETVNEHSTSDEHFENVANPEDEKLVEQEASISIVANRPPALNCYKVSGLILSDTLNNTFGSDDFCPRSGRSLNSTYIIPLSRYFKEPGFEMHFSSSIPLLWTICHDSEHTKRDGKLLIPTRKGVILPTEQNTSIMGLTVPSHGYFVRDLELRSSDDLKKDNLCQEQANDANTLLQYNIRIIRDCD